MITNCNSCKFSLECKCIPFYEQNIYSSTEMCEKYKKIMSSNPSTKISGKELKKIGFRECKNYPLAHDVIRNHEDTIYTLYAFVTYSFSTLGVYLKGDNYYLTILTGNQKLHPNYKGDIKISTIRELTYQMLKIIQLGLKKNT